jgi:sulfur relay (sulfurtransferase) DsrF/TusC family protein
MERLCFLIRTAPYGCLAAAEGVRHLIGAAAAEMDVTAILVDDGTYVAKQDQDADDTGWTSLSAALQHALQPDTRGASRRVRVYVHTPSAQDRGLSGLDLTPGVEPIDDGRLADILADGGGVLVF